jgi:hypothetical protein
MVPLTLVSLLLGALLATRYSVFALIPATLAVIAVIAVGLAIHGVHGARFSVAVLTVATSVSSLNIGYMLGLLAPKVRRKTLGAWTPRERDAR